MLKKFTHGNHENMTLERNLHFDGWRGMAIVLVLISHFLTIPGFYAGKLGVASFFVLSGALMSNILFIKKTPLALFYKRRISRILPLFFIYVSVTYIYAAFIDSAESVNYLYTISFLRAYMPALPDMWSTNIPINHLWSLNVEEHCYILLSLVTLFKILKGKECYLLIFLGLCATLLYGFYIHNAEIAPPLFQIRTEVISSFLLISAGYLLISKQIETYVRPWMVLMALIIAVTCFLSNLAWYFAFLLAPILLAFSFHHLSKLPTTLLAFFAWKPLRLIGIWSYSIYLWQHPFYFYFIEHAENVTALDRVLFLVLAISTGVVSYYLIENPIRNHMNTHWN